MLSSLALDVVHVLCQLLVAVLCERAALNHNHQGRVSAVDEIIVVQAFRSLAAVNAENLARPAHLAVRLDADWELQNLVGLVIDGELFYVLRRLNIDTVASVHHAGISELLEIHGLAAELLPVLAELLLALDWNAVVVIGRVDVGLQRNRLPDRRRVVQELDLLHLAVQVTNDLQIRDTVGFAGLDQVLENLFGVLIGVQQLDDLDHALVLGLSLRGFLDVLDVLHPDAEACNVVLVGSDALRQDRGLGGQLMQACQRSRRLYPVACIVGFLL